MFVHSMTPYHIIMDFCVNYREYSVVRDRPSRSRKQRLQLLATTIDMPIMVISYSILYLYTLYCILVTVVFLFLIAPIAKHSPSLLYRVWTEYSLRIIGTTKQ